ncbi:hypothetical protein KI387_013480, partial [Taxus chinensis]
ELHLSRSGMCMYSYPIVLIAGNYVASSVKIGHVEGSIAMVFSYARTAEPDGPSVLSSINQRKAYEKAWPLNPGASEVSLKHQNPD